MREIERQTMKGRKTSHEREGDKPDRVRDIHEREVDKPDREGDKP